MSRTTYELDMGVLGIKEVEVVGTGHAEVLEVWWTCFLPGTKTQVINIVGEIESKSIMVALRAALLTSIMNERLRGIESAI
jgi:hypothetical protein